MPKETQTLEQYIGYAQARRECDADLTKLQADGWEVVPALSRMGGETRYVCLQREVPLMELKGILIADIRRINLDHDYFLSPSGEGNWILFHEHRPVSECVGTAHVCWLRYRELIAKL